MPSSPSCYLRLAQIEVALLAWESVQSGPLQGLDLRGGLSVSDGGRPLLTEANGPVVEGSTRRPSAFQAGYILSWRGWCERCVLSSVAAVLQWPLSLLSTAVRETGGQA